jgi:hypothetical protein
VRVLPPAYLYPLGFGDIPYQIRIAVQRIPHAATRFSQDLFVAPCGAAIDGVCALGPGLGATLFAVAAAIALAEALNEEKGAAGEVEETGRKRGRRAGEGEEGHDGAVEAGWGEEQEARGEEEEEEENRKELAGGDIVGTGETEQEHGGVERVHFEQVARFHLEQRMLTYADVCFT